MRKDLASHMPQSGEILRLPRPTCLPAFARAAGLSPADIAAFGSDVTASARTILFTERGADGQPCGALSDSGPGGPRFFTTGAPRGITTSTIRRPVARIVVTGGGFHALCAAAAEGHRRDTVYVAAPGSWPTFAVLALEALLAHVRPLDAVVAMPPGPAGSLLAVRADQVITGCWPGMIDVLLEPTDWPAALRRRRGVSR